MNGFKIEMANQARITADLQLRMIKTINKRYVNSLGKFQASRLECLSTEQRKFLEEKIASKEGLDINVFDGLYQTVMEHLESKCYPNFLTSEIYIEHVQRFQNQESEVTSLKYLSSNASSVCGQQSSKANTAADDSGISGKDIFSLSLTQGQQFLFNRTSSLLIEISMNFYTFTISITIFQCDQLFFWTTQLFVDLL